MAHPYNLALHQMVTESANNGADDDQQQQHQLHLLHQRPNQLLHQNHLHSTHQVDVRMKRHPELQPYVPSDRDRCLVRGPLSMGAGSASSGGGASSISGRLGLHSSKPSSKFKVNTLTTNTNNAKSSSMKSKKCVSMTRLDQLAQPKKRIFTKHEPQTTSTIPSSSLTSSNTTSTTNSSLKSSRTSQQSNKQVQASKLKAYSPKQEVQTPKNDKVNVEIAASSPKEKSENKTDTGNLHSSQEQKPKPKQQVEKQQLQPEQLPDNEPRKVSFRRRQSEGQGRNVQLSESKTEKTSQPPPPIQVDLMQSTPDAKIAHPNLETPDTPTNKITNSTFDTGRKAFQLTSNNQASLWDELNGDTTNNKSLEPIVPIKPISEVSVINDQLSDLSLNDRHYQSATSDLVHDSETSSNGVNFSKDLESLCQDLGADLIAENMTQKLGQPETGKADKQLIETIPVFSSADKELLKTLKEDEEKRIKAEEELKELAEREERERQNRQSLVDSILLRVQNQSS